jgi:hypothetical protein
MSESKFHCNKNRVMLSVGNVHRVQRCMHSQFSSCLMQPREEFCVTETVHEMGYYLFVWHKRIGKCIPKLIPSSYVRTRCQTVFDSEHSLRL